MMQVASWLVRNVADPFARGQDFYYVTVALLSVCLLVGVLATAFTADRSRRLMTALMVALSPGLILGAFINWDLLAMSLTACGLLAWASRRPAVSGVLLGLAVAAKFYPLLMFAALFLLCLRAGKLRVFARFLGAGLAAWLVVNVPVAIASPSGWGRFYAFSQSRGADWGSAWYMFQTYKIPVLGNTSLGQLNLMTSGLFAVACVAIAALVLMAPRRPRVGQVCFLLLAAFLALNKVWSPQYVIWLVPLAVLARPRLWPYLLWQLGEVAYFFGIWAYFVYLYQTPGQTGYTGISPGWYFVTLAARLLTVALLAGYVVRDIVRAERPSEAVHRGGLGGLSPRAGTESVDAPGDPAGGLLNDAEDWLTLRWRRTASEPAVQENVG
jgi:uncharacterized membrane protein